VIRKIESVQLRLASAAFLAGILIMLGSNMANAALEDDIRARISPAGEVCVIGDRCASGLSVANTSVGGSKDPEQVYQTFCIACHGTGANESPVMGNIEAWEPRIAKGIDVLYDNAITGFNNNAMPARGLCMDCSDDDMRATVDYLVEASQ
jgi:cytochrome c5